MAAIRRTRQQRRRQAWQRFAKLDLQGRIHWPACLGGVLEVGSDVLVREASVGREPDPLGALVIDEASPSSQCAASGANAGLSEHASEGMCNGFAIA